MRSCSKLIIFALLLFPIALAEGKSLLLDKSNRNATALVSKEELVLEVETGNDYPSLDQPKKFKLVVGKCDLEVRGYSSKAGTSDVTFLIEGKKLYSSPTKLSVKNGEVRFVPDNNQGPAPCSSGSPTFTKLSDGNYTISISLGGDIPSGLKITSKDVKIYNPNVNNLKIDKSGLSGWAIAGIATGVVAILIFIAVGLGAFFFIRRRKQHKNQEQIADPEIEAPKPPAVTPMLEPKPIQIEIPTAKKEDSEKKKSGESKATGATSKQESKATGASKATRATSKRRSKATSKRESKATEISKPVEYAKEVTAKTRTWEAERFIRKYNLRAPPPKKDKSDSVLESKDQVEDDMDRFDNEQKETTRPSSERVYPLP